MRFLAALALSLLTGACTTGSPSGPYADLAGRRTAEGTAGMVTAAHPLAARAGKTMLERGGSAVDAALAVQFALNVVEPQSSGIGGGGFLLRYDGEARRITAHDGREEAPSAATPELFLRDDGTPMDFWNAVIGGRSVGVPGLLRMLRDVHRRHGELPWATLLQPAIRLAREGFPVSPRLHRLLAEDEDLRADPNAREIFYTGEGTALPVGATLRNPELAETLETIAENGVAPFYEGDIARAIVARVRTAERGEGTLRRRDLARYEAERREPLCRPALDRVVCGHPPPTSGGLTVLQILGILDGITEMQVTASRPAFIHHLMEASRLAFADRNRYVGDPAFVDVPTRRLLSDRYLIQRAGAIRPDGSLGETEPGLLTRRAAAPDGPGGRSTTHLTVRDADGNAVSMTSSIEQAFGSHVMVEGFLLNNQLTDFAFRPSVDGRPVANRVQPGKRPMSSMAPTMVVDEDGRLRLALGSPGGPRIIGYVAQRIADIRLNERGLAGAIGAPSAINRNGPTVLEAGGGWDGMAAALRQRGHAVETDPMTSGLHGLRVWPDGRVQGAADPRREGVAIAVPTQGERP